MSVGRADGNVGVASRKRVLSWPLLLGSVALGILLSVEEATMLKGLAEHVSKGLLYDDFWAYWNAANSVAAGQSPYEWLVENQPGPEAFTSVYVYPPLLAVLLAPLTQVLDYSTVRWAWLIFSVLCLVLGAALVWRTSGLRLRDRNPLILVSCLALLPSATWALVLGQLSPQLLLVIAGISAALGARQPAMAGTFLAFGAYLKSFPVLLGGYLLLRRQWRGCLAAITAGLLLVTLSLLALGWEPHWTYLTTVVPAQRLWFGLPSEVSITGFFTRLLVESPFDDPFTTPVVVAEAAAQVAIAFSAVALLVASSYAIWRARSDREGEAAAYALAVVATMLVSPISGAYNLVIALLPLAVAAAHVQAAWPRHQWWFFLALMLLSLPVFPFDLWPVPAYFPRVPGDLPPSQMGWGNLLASGPFFGLVVLWGLLVRLCLEPRPLPSSDGASR